MPGDMSGLSALLTDKAGLTIRSHGCAVRSSSASIGPLRAPSFLSWARIDGVSSENGGRLPKRQPNLPWS